jgi:hypothetical protein
MTSSSASHERDHSAAQETTPLLAASAAGPTTQANERPPWQNTSPKFDDDKALPKAQIFLLCYARLVEPIAFFSIFPFINQMIWETGHLREADVGFYSGLIVRPSPRLPILPVIDRSAAGISIFVDPDVGDDLMGSCCGSFWTKTNPSHLPDRSCNSYINIRTQQSHMADDCLQMSCRSIRGYDSVSNF